MRDIDLYQDYGRPQLNEDLTAIWDNTKRFALKEIAPFINEWDEAEAFPRQLHQQAASAGLLGIAYPEDLGGSPASYRMRSVMSLALCRYAKSGGLLSSLLTHNIALPPILHHGSDFLKQTIIPAVLSGEKIAALAITEPNGGSDVANLKTHAYLDGNDWVISGEKVFITSGYRADYLTVAVRTGEAPYTKDGRHMTKGARGISLIVVPTDLPGIERTLLKKMGWWCSDTAHIRFEQVRVPSQYVVGEVGSGFKMIMSNFNAERLSMSAAAIGFALACYDEALAWSSQRQTFGKSLIEHQVILHKLMDMQMRIQSSLGMLWRVCDQIDYSQFTDHQPDPQWVAHVCLLKNHSTQTMQFCADQGVQILGGMGFMRGTACERIYREVKVMMIGGGAEEIMKELAAKQSF